MSLARRHKNSGRQNIGRRFASHRQCDEALLVCVPDLCHVVRAGTSVSTTRPALTTTRLERAMAEAELHPESVSPQACERCGGPKVRAAWEKPNEFARRRFCSRACSNAARQVPIHDLIARHSSVAANGCIEWTSHIDASGYGRIAPRNGEVLAHRVSYEAARGSIPTGLHILHSCDNRKCINPDHLRAGTQADNSRDMIERGRAFRPVGRNNPNYRHGRFVRSASPHVQRAAREAGFIVEEAEA
jgi:hypothetical protein